MSSGKKILIALGILVVLGGIVYANFAFKRPKGVEITVERIQRRDLEAIVSASGTVQPKQSVNISADTMGRVVNLDVNEGDVVKKGQFLLQIDPMSSPLPSDGKLDNGCGQWHRGDRRRR